MLETDLRAILTQAITHAEDEEKRFLKTRMARKPFLLTSHFNVQIYCVISTLNEFLKLLLQRRSSSKQASVSFIFRRAATF